MTNEIRAYLTARYDADAVKTGAEASADEAGLYHGEEDAWLIEGVMLAKAIEADACDEALEEIKSLGSIAAVLAHPDAAYWAYWYARRVIKGRWPEAEAVIAADPEWAYCYARGVIKGRWPEAEAVIAADPKWAYRYASDVIKGRWPEAEAVIAADPEWAYCYAERVIATIAA